MSMLFELFRMWFERFLEAANLRRSSKPIVLTEWIEFRDYDRVGHAMANAIVTRCGRRATSSYSRAALDGPFTSCPACIAAGAR